jgi:long-chain acyl-CoA synthetase
MVISGGVNIYPAEIENELLKLPGVADCAVFGIPDDEFGESLCAWIQPQPGVSLDPGQIRADLATSLARFKIPKLIEFAAELPREDSGKIFKRKLREPYWEKAGRSI